MQALQLTEYRKLRLVELPMPQPGPEDVLIHIAACGICGSDVHGYDGSTGRRIPPLVMGHEAAGVIAAVGAKVRNFSVGERATFDSTISCGVCRFCAAGQINLCDNREVVGVSCGEYRRNGAFAEYIAVPARIVYRLPDTLGFAEAAMIEAVSVALHAVQLTELQAGQTVVVVGAGMIGLLILQALRASGCERVMVTDLDVGRLQMAERLGASQTLLAGDGEAGKGNVVEEIRALTGGDGADVVLEAVGSAATVRAAIAMVRKGGAVTLVGNIAPEIPLPLQSVVSRQIRLQGSCASSGEYPAAIELMGRGAIDVTPMLTAVAPLSEGAAWFERLYAREANLMKVVLTPESMA
ncbi:MAG TPA: galactitol-1-phosphate 5-dehydrogenase [Acidobacteriaceae bacterium]|nr:galactitol-1-phosphate 5-dehydrogenase [Acidobacteriaceae bacterium]